MSAVKESEVLTVTSINKVLLGPVIKVKHMESDPRLYAFYIYQLGCINKK